MTARTKATARAQIFARLACRALDFWEGAVAEAIALDRIGDEFQPDIVEFLDDVADFSRECRAEADALGHLLASRPAA